MPQGFWIIAAILLVCFIVWLAKNKTKKDNRFDDLPTHSKKQKEFFQKKNKPMQVNFKGELIEKDSHFSGILNDEQ